MTWFITANWAIVAAILFTVMNSRRLPGAQMVWTALLCAIWPLLLLFFLVGTALWFVGSVRHALKRRGQHRHSRRGDRHDAFRRRQGLEDPLTIKSKQ